MKIVVFDDLPEGGAKRVVFEQVKGLSKNHTIDYVTNTCTSIFPFDEYAHSVTRFSIELATARGFFRPFQELSFYTSISPTFNRITTLINQSAPDVVLVHPSRFTQAPLLLSLLKQKTVYFAHEWLRLVYEPDLHPLPKGVKGTYEFIRRMWLKYLDYSAVNHATEVVTTSTYNQHCCENVYKRKFKRIPLGVSTTFLGTKPQLDKGYFLFVGEKEAINGYPLLQSVGTKFDIKYITFKGSNFRYTDSELAALYSEAIATLCLAPHEPFGLTALESMACSTPVIALQDGGFTDTIVDGETGYLIKADSSLLVEKMNSLKSKPNLRNTMGKYARDYITRKFLWNTHILELEQLLTQVAYG